MTLGIRHVAFATQAIAEQRERIARLKAADCSTVAVEQTLRLFQGALGSRETLAASLGAFRQSSSQNQSILEPPSGPEINPACGATIKVRNQTTIRMRKALGVGRPREALQGLPNGTLQHEKPRCRQTAGGADNSVGQQDS